MQEYRHQNDNEQTIHLTRIDLRRLLNRKSLSESISYNSFSGGNGLWKSRNIEAHFYHLEVVECS
jgi:hypothetical protein